MDDYSYRLGRTFNRQEYTPSAFINKQIASRSYDPEVTRKTFEGNFDMFEDKARVIPVSFVNNPNPDPYTESKRWSDYYKAWVDNHNQVLDASVKYPVQPTAPGFLLGPPLIDSLMAGHHATQAIVRGRPCDLPASQSTRYI